MNREPSTVARSLRAVSLLITLIAVLALVTITYSAYQDTAANFAGASQGKGQTFHVGSPVVSGDTATTEVNMTIRNGGLYPLGITAACNLGNQTNVTCSNLGGSVSPGQTKTFHYYITTHNLMQSGGSIRLPQLNVTLTLTPFASLGFTVNLAGGGG